MKSPLILFLSPEKGEVKSVDIPVMILRVFPGARRQGRIKKILPVPALSSEKIMPSPGSRTGLNSISSSRSAGKARLHQST